jgi:hypothetical protein
MAISISQILSASYPQVLAEKRKPANQWAENAALRYMEKQGILKVVPGSSTIEASLDYQQNPDAGFFTNDFDPYGMGKTEVITAAQYTPAQLRSPVKWSKKDEASNPEENQKVALVASLLENGLTSHDSLIENALFATTTNGFLGLKTLAPTTGQGNVGGIDSAVELWWRNYAAQYAANFSDIRAVMTTAFNACAKGSGSELKPTVIIGSADWHAGFEGTLTPNERFIDTDEAKTGFKAIAFKTAQCIFSPGVTTDFDYAWFLNPKAYQVKVFKGAFRQKGDTNEIPGQSGYVCEIYSALQAVVANKSRLAVISHP